MATVHDTFSDGRRAKKAKSIEAKLPGVTNNRELRRLCDVDAPPPWYPKRQGVWDHAMRHVTHVNIKEGQSPRRFALPPIHLFWGASEQNQRTFYYHFLVLREQFMSRAEGHLGDLPGLTTDEWRSVLGNSYWKSMWPRPNPGDANSSNFDPARFWIHGGPLFFGEEMSAKVASGYDPTSCLRCRCEVEMDTADDVEIRQTVLYHLNMAHASAEIKEMDQLQSSSLSSNAKQWRSQGRTSNINTMTDMWGPCRDGGVLPGFFQDQKAWRGWLRAAREVTMVWEGFDDWNWYGLEDVRNIGLAKLPRKEFATLTNRLLTFFINTFVTHLGYYPSPMLCPPTLATHNCTIHRKKFATGLL
jgi:hypothetical protein